MVLNGIDKVNLLFGLEEGYLRYSLFEKSAYDPLSKEVTDRYSEYYKKGSISQDLRFGNVAFKELQSQINRNSGTFIINFFFSIINW